MLTAADVRAKRFAVTKFREGYDQREVDAFLERAATALDRAGAPGVMTADEVVQVRFNPTKFSAGYDQDEVDDFLDEFTVTLGATSSGTAGASPQPDPASPRGEVPRLLKVLRVMDFALFALAAALLLLELAPASIAFGMLVVSLLGGTAVQFLIFRAERKSPDGVVRAE